MKTLLYHKAGRQSGPSLAAFMGISAVRVVKEPVDCLIRWGLATKVEPVPSVEINPRSSLVRYFSRLKQLELLKQYEVSVPPYSLEPNVGFPMLGRNEGRKRQSTRGLGITYYDDGDSLVLKHSFYVRFFPKQRQFRVHVIGKETRTRELIPNFEPGEPIYGLGEGMHDSVIDTTEDLRAQPIWNLDAGFTYRNLKSPRPLGVVPQAKLAVEALKLDFGAVDIIVHDNQPYVLEVNTAPGLHDLTLSWYARHLSVLIGLDPKALPGLQEG